MTLFNAQAWHAVTAYWRRQSFCFLSMPDSSLKMPSLCSHFFLLSPAPRAVHQTATFPRGTRLESLHARCDDQWLLDSRFVCALLGFQWQDCFCPLLGELFHVGKRLVLFMLGAPPRDSDFDRAVPCLLGGKSAELCFQPALAVQGQKKKKKSSSCFWN